MEKCRHHHPGQIHHCRADQRNTGIALAFVAAARLQADPGDAGILSLERRKMLLIWGADRAGTEAPRA